MMLNGSSTVVVHTQDSSGAPVMVAAKVRLVANNAGSGLNGPGQYTATTKDGLATISGVAGGDYIVEVIAEGFRTSQTKLTVQGAMSKIDAVVKLVTFDGSEDPMQLEQPGEPPLNARARKDLELALAALAAGQPANAEPHVRDALKADAKNPDVHYVAGVYAERTNNGGDAQTQYEAGIALFKDHFASQLSLGDLLLQSGFAADAIPHLERALVVGPNSWRAHWLYAEAVLQANRDAAKATEHANRALELGKEKAVDAEITLALAEALDNKFDQAKARLEKFLQDHPNDPGAARAKQSLQMLAPIH